MIKFKIWKFIQQPSFIYKPIQTKHVKNWEPNKRETISDLFISISKADRWCIRSEAKLNFQSISIYKLKVY